MAKSGKIETYKRNIEKSLRYKPLRDELRSKSTNVNLSEEERIEAREKLQSLPRSTSIFRIKNRCQVTGRPRGYLRKFGMSRIAFRELALKGQIPGVTKSSW